MRAGKRQDFAEESLPDFYNRVRAYTEELCQPLEIEDYIPQPIVDVSPPKWNIAHTTWFFEEMILKRFVPDYKAFDLDFGFLFNSYYNTIGERTLRDHRGDLSRPTVKRVFDYRKYVDKKMLELLSGPAATDQGSGPLYELVVLGLNHEQQHQELFLTDLKYTLARNPLFPVYKDDFAPVETTENGIGGFIEIDEGIFGIGHSGSGFVLTTNLPGTRSFFTILRYATGS
jgi:hypothetical protein